MRLWGGRWWWWWWLVVGLNIFIRVARMCCYKPGWSPIGVVAQRRPVRTVRAFPQIEHWAYDRVSPSHKYYNITKTIPVENDVCNIFIYFYTQERVSNLNKNRSTIFINCVNNEWIIVRRTYTLRKTNAQVATLARPLWPRRVPYTAARRWVDSAKLIFVVYHFVYERGPRQIGQVFREHETHTHWR